METKNMIYLVSEYASQGEIFGKFFFLDLDNFATFGCGDSQGFIFDQ